MKITGRLPRRLLLGGVALTGPALAGILLFSGWLSSEEEALPDGAAEALVQAPIMSIDMDPAGNTYDDTTNSMTLGQTDYCLETAAPGNNEAHTHPVHLVIRGVEDLVGWQARLNYEGAQMRPLNVNFTPFADTNTGQAVSFLNLPLETGAHRSVVTASNIPPPAVGPQTALIDSTYVGQQNFAVSPDTPAKVIPDDSSYSAPDGGVLALINLQVNGNRAGPDVLFMDLDDRTPNAPGTSVVVFTGEGTSTIEPLEATLGDGFHGEGTSCLVPGPLPTVDPGLIPPPPEAEGGTSVVPPGLTPPPESPLAQPSYITIRGQQVPLAPGMTYGQVSGVGDGFPEPGATPTPYTTPRLLWKISYDSDPAQTGFSWVYFDDNFTLLGQYILPEDQEEFQPILDALAGP